LNLDSNSRIQTLTPTPGAANKIARPESNIAESASLFVRELRKSFRTPAGARLEVLRGVSFTVEAGRMVAITGASGAGKSTLLHVVGGLEAADSGELKLGDFDIAGARENSRLVRFRNAEVGFVFQSHHLLPDLTAVENVALPLFIGRAARHESLERAREALGRVGLAERASHGTRQLSGGEQQRVALARAIVKRPRLLLADEPTGNLDAEAGDRMGALLASYCRERGAVLLIATHNQRLAQGCDRTLLLEAGRLFEAGRET
jgi:lipoprotein-releasing system ATP-binding protein